MPSGQAQQRENVLIMTTSNLVEAISLKWTSIYNFYIVSLYFLDTALLSDMCY